MSAPGQNTAGMFVSIYVARIYRNGMSRPTFIVDWQRTILKS